MDTNRTSSTGRFVSPGSGSRSGATGTIDATHSYSFDIYDRMRKNTAPEINAKIDQGIVESVRLYYDQSPSAISRRIGQLEMEWDVERVLQSFASTVTLVGLLFSLTRSRLWLLLPISAMSLLLQNVVQGWSPPMLIARGLAFRTRSEIDAEKTALKVLRGDFAFENTSEGSVERANAALRAIGISGEIGTGVVTARED